MAIKAQPGNELKSYCEVLLYYIFFLFQAFVDYWVLSGKINSYLIAAVEMDFTYKRSRSKSK